MSRDRGREEVWTVEGDPVGRDAATFAIVLRGSKNLPETLVRASRLREVEERLSEVIEDDAAEREFSTKQRLRAEAAEQRLREVEEERDGAREAAAQEAVNWRREWDRAEAAEQRIAELEAGLGRLADAADSLTVSLDPADVASSVLSMESSRARSLLGETE